MSKYTKKGREKPVLCVGAGEPVRLTRVAAHLVEYARENYPACRDVASKMGAVTDQVDRSEEALIGQVLSTIALAASCDMTEDDLITFVQVTFRTVEPQLRILSENERAGEETRCSYCGHPKNSAACQKSHP